MCSVCSACTVESVTDSDTLLMIDGLRGPGSSYRSGGWGGSATGGQRAFDEADQLLGVDVATANISLSRTQVEPCMWKYRSARWWRLVY